MSLKSKSTPGKSTLGSGRPRTLPASGGSGSENSPGRTPQGLTPPFRIAFDRRSRPKNLAGASPQHHRPFHAGALDQRTRTAGGAEWGNRVEEDAQKTRPGRRKLNLLAEEPNSASSTVTTTLCSTNVSRVSAWRESVPRGTVPALLFVRLVSSASSCVSRASPLNQFNQDMAKKAERENTLQALVFSQGFFFFRSSNRCTST